MSVRIEHAPRAVLETLQLERLREVLARLKRVGRDLPLVESLRCVDAVAVFGGDDPCQLLEQFRPDIWVKGGDYTEEQLPEAPVVNSWGGRVVVVPYLDGRSTSAILDGRSIR